MSNFTTKAFIGKIAEVPTEDKDGKDDVMYFVSLSIPHQSKNNENKYQYVSCYVGTSLKRLFASAYGAQTINEKGHAQHSLTDHIINVEIHELFFEINDEGYLNGKGILSSFSVG